MKTATAPLQYTLTQDDIAGFEVLVEKLTLSEPGPGASQFYDQAWHLRGLLPTGLGRFLDNLRRAEPAAAVHIKGFPVDDAQAGPTPEHWQTGAASATTVAQEISLALVGMALGEPFSWSTLQDGRLINNVLPIRGDEDQQSGHGSDVLLEWHTEDGFHPNRCDYLLLFGIRNHDAVPTTLASVRDVEVSPEHRDVLFQERYFILPDEEHLRQLASSRPDHPGLLRMRAMQDNPTSVAVLSGDRTSPYLRIDPFFMHCANGDDTEAREALGALVAELDRVRQDVVIERGSLLIVDNYLAVHGRKAFAARYDGTDRWLKKLVVTRDLRKSRDERASAADRVLF